MKPQTILVVDDNEDDIFLLEHALRALHFINPFQVLDNGEDAIAYFEGSGPYADRSRYPTPGLLLLDLHLPLNTGFEVLEWLRRNPHPELKVIVCTGTASPDERELASSLGAMRVFEKIPDFSRFVQQITNLPGVCVIPGPDGQELKFDCDQPALTKV